MPKENLFDKFQFLEASWYKSSSCWFYCVLSNTFYACVRGRFTHLINEYDLKYFILKASLGDGWVIHHIVKQKISFPFFIFDEEDFLSSTADLSWYNQFLNYDLVQSPKHAFENNLARWLSNINYQFGSQWTSGVDISI